MAVTVQVDDRGIDVRITGLFDQAMCLSKGIHVGFDDVVNARVAEWDEARAGMGWRVGGAYWPGRIATGWYMVANGKGRQFWAVFRHHRDQLLVVETKLEKPTRLVIATPDCERLADEINRKAGAPTA